MRSCCRRSAKTKDIKKGEAVNGKPERESKSERTLNEPHRPYQSRRRLTVAMKQGPLAMNRSAPVGHESDKTSEQETVEHKATFLLGDSMMSSVAAVAAAFRLRVTSVILNREKKRNNKVSINEREWTAQIKKIAGTFRTTSFHTTHSSWGETNRDTRKKYMR